MKEQAKPYLLLSSLLFLLLMTSNRAISQNQNQVNIVKKTAGTSDEKTSETLRRHYGNNSGVIIQQNESSVIYKSILRDFEEVNVELQDRQGTVLYAYSNPIQKSVDYAISLENIDKGEYILRFEYENRLVVCNVQVL